MPYQVKTIWLAQSHGRKQNKVLQRKVFQLFLHTWNNLIFLAY